MQFREFLNESPSRDIMLKSLTHKLKRAGLNYKIKEKMNHSTVVVGKYTISVGGTFAGEYTVFEKIGSNINELGSYEWDQILKLIGSLDT